MQTVMQELIDEIFEHLTYDDDLTNDSRNMLEKVRIKCIRKLEKERQQIIDAHMKGQFTPSHKEVSAEEYYNQTYNK